MCWPWWGESCHMPLQVVGISEITLVFANLVGKTCISHPMPAFLYIQCVWVVKWIEDEYLCLPVPLVLGFTSLVSRACKNFCLRTAERLRRSGLWGHLWDSLWLDPEQLKQMSLGLSFQDTVYTIMSEHFWHLLHSYTTEHNILQFCYFSLVKLFVLFFYKCSLF